MAALPACSAVLLRRFFRSEALADVVLELRTSKLALPPLQQVPDQPSSSRRGAGAGDGAGAAPHEGPSGENRGVKRARLEGASGAASAAPQLEAAQAV